VIGAASAAAGSGGPTVPVGAAVAGMASALTATAAAMDSARSAQEGAAGNDVSARDADFERAWDVATSDWRRQSEKVDKENDKVKSAMLALGDPGLRVVANRGLPDLSKDHMSKLTNAIAGVERARGEDRRTAAGRVLAAINDFRTHLAADERVRALDEHGQDAFGVRTNIRGGIEEGLGALERALDFALA